LEEPVQQLIKMTMAIVSLSWNPDSQSMPAVAAESPFEVVPDHDSWPVSPTAPFLPDPKAVEVDVALGPTQLWGDDSASEESTSQASSQQSNCAGEELVLEMAELLHLGEIRGDCRRYSNPSSGKIHAGRIASNVATKCGIALESLTREAVATAEDSGAENLCLKCFQCASSVQ